MILVSSCLLGLNVRFDGSNCLHKELIKQFDKENVTHVCPELFGGLSIPREPAEIIGGTGEDVLNGKAKVMTISGRDVTKQFIEGANKTLKMAQELKATIVILKERSPSCGSSMIYNGEFNGIKKTGNGVTAALLKRNGINVLSEETINLK